MKTYELSYIVSPEVTSQEAEAKAREIESAIQSREGIILKQSNPVAKTLAFPIAKRASGFFGILEFQVEPEKLLEIKEVVAKDGKIIRHMVIIKEPIRIRKERRSKTKQISAEQKPETKIEKPVLEEQKPSETKGKVELKDIEEKLEELLG
ncbi:MAG: 30S ribosomal protein S6 [Candidatus Staskawiczbacteria bacterium]|nr:30S ribosomal protein S6 [Candidatus Staskawiczbacteria bacterium]